MVCKGRGRGARVSDVTPGLRSPRQCPRANPTHRHRVVPHGTEQLSVLGRDTSFRARAVTARLLDMGDLEWPPSSPTKACTPCRHRQDGWTCAMVDAVCISNLNVCIAAKLFLAFMDSASLSSTLPRSSTMPRRGKRHSMEIQSPTCADGGRPLAWSWPINGPSP